MSVTKSYKIQSVFSSTELKNEVTNLTVENTSLKNTVTELKEGTITHLDLSSTGITSVRAHAYENYTNLISVRLPYGDFITGHIEVYAFAGCENLIDISGQITYIDNYSFANCYKLEHISVSNYGNNLRDIGKYGLQNCRSLKTLDLSKSPFMGFNDYALSGCSGLTKVVIPAETSIYKNVFEGCTSLTQLEYKGTKSQWNARYRDRDWNTGSSLTKVICTDGTITL